MPGTEQNVQVTPGSGAGVDTINVGSGAVGSTAEALRQVVVVGDPSFQSALLDIDLDGALKVRNDLFREMLLELRRIRFGISILIKTDLSKGDVGTPWST